MPNPDWVPSVEDVGAVLYARTLDSNGNYLGTFNDSTRPTADQVDALIDTAVADLSAEAGVIDDSIQDNARRVAALSAALLVEMTFWPEQISSDRSAYDVLNARFEKASARLMAQVAELQAGDELGGGDDEMLAVFSFGDSCDPEIIGLQTRF